MKRPSVIKQLQFTEFDLVASRLKKEGIVATPTRVAVLSAFYISGHHELNANEIYVTLQKNQARVSLSTIYNVIHFLCASGVLRIGASVNGVKFYEFNDDQHPSQLVCCKCGFRQKFTDTGLVDRCKNLVQASGFEAGNFTLFIQGICGGCQY